VVDPGLTESPRHTLAAATKLLKAAGFAALALAVVNQTHTAG